MTTKSLASGTGSLEPNELGESKIAGELNLAKVIGRPCDSTSGNLNKTSVREKSRRVYLAIFDDISLMLNVRRLCVVVDSLISAAKVCDCVIAWLNCGLAKILCASH